MTKPTLSIIHDTRRAVKDGRFPVRLQVIFRVTTGERTTWVPKYFGKGNYCTIKEYETFSNPRSEDMRKLKTRMNALYSKATGIIDKNDGLTPDVFESIFEGKARDTVNAVYAIKIAELRAAGQIGNLWSYESSLHSLMRFKLHIEYARHKHGEDEKEKDWIEANMEAPEYALRFPEVDADFLVDYESWMIKEGNAINSVGIYLRSLRHIFNVARGETPGKKKLRLIPHDLYPFEEYQIKSESKFKIALNDKEITSLKAFKSKDESLMEARDYWLFSYYCNGMNFADVAKLRGPDLMEELLVYDRKKTRRTKKRFKQIVIPVDHEIMAIVKRRGAKTLDPNAYVFPILDNDIDETEIKKRVGSFIKKTNDSLDRIAKALNIKKNLTTVIARHSYANRILNATDGDTRMIQDGLGHSNAQTSEHYKGTLYLEKIKKAREAL
jgi:integrase